MRKDLDKRIRKKLAEIKEVDDQISELTTKRVALRAVVDELESIVRQIPKDIDTQDADRDLREGSDVFLARRALQKARKPLHITPLLIAMEMEPTVQRRRSVSSQIAAYVRKGEIFMKTAPNTFGLHDYGDAVYTSTEDAIFASIMENDAKDEKAHTERVSLDGEWEPTLPTNFDEDIPF